MLKTFDELLERKKRIFETAWHTFLYLLKKHIDPTPENYAKFFRIFYERPPQEDNPVKKVVRKTNKVLDKTKASLEEIEGGIRTFSVERRFSALVEKLVKKIEREKITIDELQKEIKKLEDELEAVRRDKYIDPLTGMWNRYTLEEFLEELPKLAMEKNIVVAFIDLNKFKAVNDTYGHLVGDKLLKFFADYMRSNLKRKDFFARFGGDEFVAILFDIDLEDAQRLFEKLRKNIPPFKFGNKEIQIDFCVGLTVPFGSDKPSDILARADGAMYKCKKSGKVEIELK